MTNYLSKTQMAQAKRRLTRARNSGDHRQVVAVVNETFAEWDAGDFAYPDNWHDWERARQDAEFAIMREAW